MTPKEKAKELIRKFYSIGAIECKKCALISVNLILDNKTFLISIPLIDIKYWEEVKQEIEQL